jgi:GT2 family glycosyltransferase
MDAKVYAIILNWNCWQQTVECVASVQSSTRVRPSVVIVDNGSQDGSVSHLRAALPDANILQTGENLGYAAGNRVGVTCALREGADLVWILNPDCRVDQNCLTELVRMHCRYPQAILGSLVLTSVVRPKIYFAGAVIERRYRFIDRVIYPSRGREASEVVPLLREDITIAVNGSSMIIPASTIKRYGFMDESFFLYHEETDYCLRLAKLGVHSVLVPKAVAYHPEKSAASSWRTYYQIRNGLEISRRYFGMGCFLARAVGIAVSTVGGRLEHFGKRCQSDSLTLLAIWHALIGRRGRTIDPACMADLFRANSGDRYA